MGKEDSTSNTFLDAFPTKSSETLPKPIWFAIDHHITEFCSLASSPRKLLIVVQIWRDSVEKKNVNHRQFYSKHYF